MNQDLLHRLRERLRNLGSEPYQHGSFDLSVSDLERLIGLLEEKVDLIAAEIVYTTRTTYHVYLPVPSKLHRRIQALCQVANVPEEEILTAAFIDGVISVQILEKFLDKQESLRRRAVVE